MKEEIQPPVLNIFNYANMDKIYESKKEFNDKFDEYMNAVDEYMNDSDIIRKRISEAQSRISENVKKAEKMLKELREDKTLEKRLKEMREDKPFKKQKFDVNSVKSKVKQLNVKKNKKKELNEHLDGIISQIFSSHERELKKGYVNYRIPSDGIWFSIGTPSYLTEYDNEYTKQYVLETLKNELESRGFIVEIKNEDELFITWKTEDDNDSCDEL